MPFFPNAQNFVLNNNHLTDITVNAAGPTGIDILFEASIPEAAHDSSARDPTLRCFPGTRQQHIEDIVNWALPAVGDTPLPIYWMKGPAGVGKSAVAQTCAEKLKRMRKLGAAFFFSTNRHSKSNDMSKKGRGEHFNFFTSIAYQLSTVYSDYHDLLDKKIRRDKSLVDKSMESQFWGLIVEPLQELEEKGLGVGKRIPVFVDGLDECESREAQREIVEIVAAAARDGAVPLCWAFFSRPEPHIEATFSKPGVSPLCHKTILPISRDADGEIELYLRVGFEDILQRLNIVMSSPWPSDSDMKEIVRAAGGLFIYAKTVLRFVGQPDSLDPEELLRALIDLISNRDLGGPAAEPAFAELDAFYMLILQRIPAKLFLIIHRLLTALCRMPFPSAIMVANYLGLSRVEVEAVCSQLGAVVNFQHQREPLDLDPNIDTSQSFLQTNPQAISRVLEITGTSLGGSISFHHKSFKDFLLNPLRSGVYSINATTEFRERDIVLQFERHHHWQGSELVRAPGVSAASVLSYPYMNGLVNSVIEALLYFVVNGEFHLGADFDFRKHLYVVTTVYTVTWKSPGAQITSTTYRCASFRKFVRRSVLYWLQPGEFPKLDVVEFKEHLEDRQQRYIIRPYHSTSPFLDKPRGRVESGLYINGRDAKSVFWYWEINYDSETLREFYAIDLAEGERIYREQFGEEPCYPEPLL